MRFIVCFLTALAPVFLSATAQELHSSLLKANDAKEWNQVLETSDEILGNFPTSPFAEEALFYAAAAHYHLGEYELAIAGFSDYLKNQTAPKYFEEAIVYKFEIAEKFKSGQKKHLLGWRAMPKWEPAEDDAVSLYDEVITALPHHDVGAKALFSKARLLLSHEDYKGAIESYQTLIRRFPKHRLSPDSYVGIGGVYLSEAKLEYPDPDFLDLAELNLRKFRQDFPSDERVEVTVYMLNKMKEIYALDLYDTGKYFERTKRPQAAQIYYTKIMKKFPDTKIAKHAQKRLDKTAGTKSNLPT